MEYPPAGNGDVDGLLLTTGTRAKPDENGFVPITIATWVFPLGGSASPLNSVHIKTDAIVAGTFTIETCNFPAYKGDSGAAPADVPDFDATVGNWIKEDPTTAYVGTTAGTGWTVTNLTLVKTAAAGGAIIHLGNLGSRRVRLKAVITTAGGVRVSRWAKA